VSQGAASHASLGHLYLHGLGVPKDVDLARAYFTTGVAADDPASLNALGLMLLNGVGMNQDVLKGAEYIKRAVDKGHVEAYFNLAMLKLRVRFPCNSFNDCMPVITVLVAGWIGCWHGT
jgi:TPR repeat protein